MYVSSKAISRQDTTSFVEVNTVFKNLEKSISEYLSDPSAIFKTIESKALYNCERSIKFSLSGNFFIDNCFSSVLNNLVCLYTGKFLNLNIFVFKLLGC